MKTDSVVTVPNLTENLKSFINVEMQIRKWKMMLMI